MSEVTIIRHAYADYPNDALSNIGRQQASDNAGRFSGYTNVICSQKLRSQETAKLLGYSTPKIDRRLNEFEADLKAPTQEEYVALVHKLHAKKLYSLGKNMLIAISYYGLSDDVLIVSHNAIMSACFLLLNGEIQPFNNLEGFKASIEGGQIVKTERV